MANQRGKRGGPELRAAREVLALKLRQGGHTYREIGQQLACGTATALRYVQNSLARLAQENTAEAQGLLALELARLDDLYRAAYVVLETAHPLVCGGVAVEHQGHVLTDHAPTLRAIDRLVRISERRCALLGLNAPKQDAGVEAIVGALKQFAEVAPV